MDFTTYQKLAAEYIVYPPDKELAYLSHALLAEVGEIHGVLASIARGDDIAPDALAFECGDVLWVLAMMLRRADVAQVDPLNAAAAEYVSSAELRSLVSGLTLYALGTSDCIVVDNFKGAVGYAPLICDHLERISGCSLSELMTRNLAKLETRRITKALKKGVNRD